MRRLRTVLGVFRWEGWTKLTAVATAVAAVGALWYTGQAQRSTTEQFASQYDLTVRSQYTEQFGQAVDLLGSPTVDVRLGGIHALNRLGRDSDKDRETIIDILGSYTRIHAQAVRYDTVLRCTPPMTKSGARSVTATVPPAPVEPDVATAVGAVGRLQALSTNKLGVQLPGICLEGITVNSGWFVDCSFSGTSLRYSHFRAANLNRADLSYANLSNADLAYAQMAEAKLVGANLSDADLSAAPLRNADLSRANLYRVRLTDPATGKRADLTGANLQGANLTGVDLSGFDLSQTDLTGAIGYKR